MCGSFSNLHNLETISERFWKDVQTTQWIIFNTLNKTELKKNEISDKKINAMGESEKCPQFLGFYLLRQ